ncbi:nudC domain-containing 2 [Micractinium conductrix]|uniref:NudC domain-containing 2 n=1 Tax=Micractinium conductrix TaxID=554055 RepID=A0A2P6V8X0_9CHLO|nr:nudC domain-containing 2 [Micractinium conductrix]|eukprot:PSC70531.1 nudC domain-containing 2 [Micractinium conductrix]
MTSADKGVHIYKHEGRDIYSWEQTLSEVSIYIQVPPGVRAKQLEVAIQARHLRVGIQGLPSYLDKPLGGAVKPSDSCWTLEDGTLNILLAKAEEGATWASAIAGHELRGDQQEADQKRLLLERFQEEHPGFDFSSAEFSGGVPDPRTFTRDAATSGPWQARGATWQQRAAAPAGRPRRLPARRHCGATAVSSPERVTVTDRTPAPPSPEVEVRVIGFGGRGAAALNKLVSHGKVAAGDAWCLDVDAAALDAAPTSNTLLLPKDDAAGAEGRLGTADVQRLVGRAASDAGGRGNINAGTDGAVAFVLAPAAAAPGGAATVLQVVQALRAAGHFTVAAVTRPFGFEGAAKQEQADDLVAALRQSAHMVAVMEQDVLLQAFGDAQMTVAEATNIADNALEHSIRCILQAVQAPEILRSSRGALMWHSRDLRHFKRILSPPLQQLLTRPGTAVLGRGLASMPAATAHQMGASQAFMHLASDAVRAAADSPFLDGALVSAGGVLCSISLPPAEQRFDTGSGTAAVLQGLQAADGARRAMQMAAQAAAGALGTMSGPCCEDFVLCAEPRAEGEASADSGTVQVQVTLLVLCLPDGQQGAGAPRGGLQAGAAPRFRVGPALPQPPRQQPAAPQRLPASSWNMLSAMAGGAAGNSGKAAAAPGSQQEGAQRGEQPADAAAPAEPQERRMTVGDQLVNSLTAQSLDLPPAAARWRQEHRGDASQHRKLIVWEVDESEPWEEEEEPQGLAALLPGLRREKRVNVRERMASILMQDREDAWEAEGSSVDTD